MNVVTVEYPGYGLNFSRGIPTDYEIKETSRAVITWLMEKLQLQASDLVIWGRSMGTGVSTELVTQGMSDPPAALILTSPYWDLKNVLNGRCCSCCVLSCLQKNHFNNGALIGKTKCPVLLIHGDQDKVILHNHSKALYKKAKEEKHEDEVTTMTIVPGTGHGAWDKLVSPQRSFIESIGLFGQHNSL